MRHKRAEHNADLELKRQASQGKDMLPKKRRKSPSPASSDELSTLGSQRAKYKLAKAKLHYILRENEMLHDEWQSTNKRLKRLQTERKVLLDALMGSDDEDEENIEIRATQKRRMEEFSTPSDEEDLPPQQQPQQSQQ